MYKFTCSSFAVAFSRLSFAKRPLSNAVKSLAISACLVLFTSAHDKGLQDRAAIDDTATSAMAPAMNEEVVIKGLSRQRSDFDKALNLLAGAVADDSRLAEYLGDVRQRVQGKSVQAESGSGIRVIKPGKKTHSGRSGDHQAAATAATQAQSQPAGAWGRLKSFVSGAMVSTSEAAPSASQGARPDQSAAATGERGSSGLVVGDVAFETNPAIEQWVNYYLQHQVGRKTMTIGLRRSDSYLELARAEFRRLGVPQDLVWLAFVESVWHPGAMSHAKAGGIWQFIPKTATEYGLEVAAGYDERFDPTKQTRVAATYLRDLHTIFGDWALAMAAYNCGEPRVMDAIIKNGRADFWEIAEKELLPKETRNYVPKILAAIKVAGAAESYGFDTGAENDAMTAGR